MDLRLFTTICEVFPQSFNTLNSVYSKIIEEIKLVNCSFIIRDSISSTHLLIYRKVRDSMSTDDLVRYFNYTLDFALNCNPVFYDLFDLVKIRHLPVHRYYLIKFSDFRVLSFIDYKIEVEKIEILDDSTIVIRFFKGFYY